MIPIPYAKRYSATAHGSVPKLVTCESCTLEYVYLLEASAQGEGTSLLFLDNQGAAERSKAKAQAELQAALEQGIAVVPCPGCGRIQEHMVALAQEERHTWMITVAGASLLGSVIAFLIALLMTCASATWEESITSWVIFGTTFGIGIVLMIVRGVLVARFDPNAESVEARLARGRAAVTKADFLKEAKEQGPET